MTNCDNYALLIICKICYWRIVKYLLTMANIWVGISMFCGKTVSYGNNNVILVSTLLYNKIMKIILLKLGYMSQIHENLIKQLCENVSFAKML